MASSKLMSRKLFLPISERQFSGVSFASFSNLAACPPQMPRMSQPQTLQSFVALQLSGFGRRHNSAITFKSLAFWVLLPGFQPLAGSIEPRRESGTQTPAAMLPGSRSTLTTIPLPRSSRGSATHLLRQDWQGDDVNR